jgi:hypothetical protein
MLTRGNAEKRTDETHFTCDAELQQDALALADHTHDLEALGSPSSVVRYSAESSASP